MNASRFSAPFAAEAWPAPAKLNRFLHIVGRREDGYHLLQTLFQFVEYGDWLHFELRDDGRVVRASELPGVAVDDDLVVRAARLLQEQVPCSSPGVTIRVDKHLPMGGGIGGGSSDAATTLVALNHLWHCGLDEDALAMLGLRLGADVPVFVRGRAAWAEGVGERLTPVDIDELWFLVVAPACAVPTVAVFKDPELTRDSAPIRMRDFLAGGGRNDCAAVVYRRFPEVAVAAEWLAQFTQPHLSGTGACVFGGFPSSAAANVVLASLPAGWRAFVARGLNRSPLLERLIRG